MPIRLAALLAIVVCAAALPAGCGGSSPDGGSTTSPPARSETQAPPAAGAPVGAAARSCETDAVDVEGLRATGISCDQARQVMYGWQRVKACAGRAGASRSACTSRSYRCLGARTDRGVAVSCSRPGRSIAFIAKRR